MIAAVATLLGACVGGSAPPPGYEAIAPAGTQPGETSCPDLRGTFDIAGNGLAASIAGRPPPTQTFGLPMLLTFKNGPSTIEGWWVVPRERLVAFANDQSKDAPKRYARWRQLMLDTRRPDLQAYESAVAEVGPPGPTFAQVTARGCRDHWMLVASSTGQDTAKDGSPRSVERETWLARDAAGALLVRNVTYTLKHYSLWAASTQSFRTSRHATYQRVPQVDPESAAPLVSADLPEDPLTRPRPPMTCAELPARVEAFSQRLKALLPPKTQVARFALKPVRQNDDAGHCPFAVVDVEIVGDNAYFLARTVDWVRADADVDSVELLRPADGVRRDNVNRLRVVLH